MTITFMEIHFANLNFTWYFINPQMDWFLLAKVLVITSEIYHIKCFFVSVTVKEILDLKVIKEKCKCNRYFNDFFEHIPLQHQMRIT